MSIHIVQIDKHKFVSGLFWQSLSRPRDLWNEAKELAKKIDGDMAVIRQNQTVAQAGFAHTKDGVRKGMHSLAATIANTVMIEGAFYDGKQQPVHNWLAAFKLPDGMWAYCAVRDANFLPNGDFAGTKEQVLDRLYGDYGLGGWNVVIGSPELEESGFHNFSAKDLLSLLPHKKNGKAIAYKWSALRPVEKKIQWMPIVVGATAVAVLGTTGVIYWKSYQRAQEEKARASAIEATRQAMFGQNTAAVVRPPWAHRPLPNAVAQTCMEHFGLLAPGGWMLEQYVCTPEQAEYSWGRNGSTVDFLLSQVANAKIDLSGEKASYTVPLKSSPGSEEALIEASKLHVPLLAQMQMLGLTLKMTLVPPSETSLPYIQKAAAPVQKWKIFAFSVDLASLPPKDIAAILNQPGVRLDRMIYRAGVWSLEGVMYAL